MSKFLKRDIFGYFQMGPYGIRAFSLNRILLAEKKYLEMKQNNGVRTITLSDPSSRNSLSLAMLKSLVINIKKDENNIDLRSIVIRSVPGSVFSAGHNLKELVR